MKVIAISQRIVIDDERAEKRDALDQRWWQFLECCHVIPLIIPNNLALVAKLLQTVPIQGVLLTGGSDAPEREEVEFFLIEYALDKQLPLFGVCHGMQMIQKYFGISLKKVANHVTHQQEILINGKAEIVNSYHDYGAFETNQDIHVWAKAHDGVIKAVKHVNFPIAGIMWHPERITPYAERDTDLITNFFC